MDENRQIGGPETGEDETEEFVFEEPVITWRLVFHILLCVVGIAIILMLMNKAKSEMAEYSAPAPVENTAIETATSNENVPDIPIGVATQGESEAEPQEPQITEKEKSKKQSYRQIRQVIHGQVIE